MSKRMKLDDMRNILAVIVERNGEYVQDTKGETNPQIIEMRNRLDGQLELAQAVLDALNGNNCTLRGYIW